MGTSAEGFDSWYTDRAGSPAADELVHRALGLPAQVQSTSLLSWAALKEVVAALEMRAGQVLLDLACGRGGYGLEIARRLSVRLVGVDFSAVAISEAQHQAQILGMADRADFRIGDLAGTGLPAASVDAVLIVDAIQFAEPTVDALQECRRVLAPGGRAVLTCWEALDPTDDQVPPRLRHLDLATQLPLAGFVNVEVTEKPSWRTPERALWQEASTIAADTDPGLESLQDEARRVLAIFDKVRRILATATAPD
jgi:ubiquinone/menaquinone biosynthesis C-methylase UbiE